LSSDRNVLRDWDICFHSLTILRIEAVYNYSTVNNQYRNKIFVFIRVIRDTVHLMSWCITLIFKNTNYFWIAENTLGRQRLKEACIRRLRMHGHVIIENVRACHT